MKGKLIACAAASLAVAGIVRATDVTGQVKLAAGKPAANAVVYLTGHGHGTPLKHAVVNQRHMAFTPHVSIAGPEAALDSTTHR